MNENGKHIFYQLGRIFFDTKDTFSAYGRSYRPGIQAYL